MQFRFVQATSSEAQGAAKRLEEAINRNRRPEAKVSTVASEAPDTLLGEDLARVAKVFNKKVIRKVKQGLDDQPADSICIHQPHEFPQTNQPKSKEKRD